MYVCLCNGITETQIREAICDGAQSMGELRGCLGVAANCGRCADFAEQVLKETLTAGNPRLQLSPA